MPRARLRLTVPTDVWIGRISQKHPTARVRILAALPDGETGISLAEIKSPEIPTVLAAFEAADEIAELELLQTNENQVLVQFETSEPLLLFPVRDSGIPLELPFVIQDGEAVWEVTASQSGLSQLGEQLEAVGIGYTVDYVKQHVEPNQLLTERQRRLVQAAIDHGYYDTPRECSLTELAEILDIAKSTCSETLHRAEEKIMKQFIQENPDTTQSNAQLLS